MAVPWRRNNSFYRKYLYNFVLLYKNRADLKMFLEIMLSLSTVIIFGAFAIRPTFLTIANLVSEINLKRDVSKQLDDKISNIAIAQENMQTAQDQIALLNDSIPSETTPQTYIRQIEGLVAKNSVSLEQIRIEKAVLVGDDTDAPAIDEFPNEAGLVETTVGVSGQYSDLATFLKDFESARRPFVIKTLSFNSSVAAGGEKLTLTLTGYIPYLKQTKEQ